MWFFFSQDVFVLSRDQIQALQLFQMLPCIGHGIDSRGFQAAVSQKVRKQDYILLPGVEFPCKEVPEVVGEYLFSQNPSTSTEGFHKPTDVRAIQGLPVSGYEYRTAFDMAFPYVFL